MSTFVRFGAQLLTSRQKVSRLGWDSLGELSFNPQFPLLVLNAEKNSAEIVGSGLRYQGAQILAGTLISFQQTKELMLKGTSLLLWFGNNPLAEIVARTHLATLELIQESYKKARLVSFYFSSDSQKRALKIPEGISLRCGSSEQDTLFFENQDLKKAHAEVLLSKDGTVGLKPLTSLIAGSSLPQTFAVGEDIVI